MPTTSCSTRSIADNKSSSLSSSSGGLLGSKRLPANRAELLTVEGGKKKIACCSGDNQESSHGRASDCQPHLERISRHENLHKSEQSLSNSSLTNNDNKWTNSNLGSKLQPLKLAAVQRSSGSSFINSDESVFTLNDSGGRRKQVMPSTQCSSSPFEPHVNGASSNHNSVLNQSNDSLRNQVTSGSNQASDQLTAIGRRQEQHRRLQYQVHQQLQRIYGNKLQEIEQQQNQKHKQQSTPSRQPPPPPLPASNKKPKTIMRSQAILQQQQQQQQHHHHHLCLTNGTVNPIAMDPQLIHRHHHHHHQQEQAYDSLDSMATSGCNALQQVAAPVNSNFYDLQPQNRRQARQVICGDEVGARRRQMATMLNQVDMVNGPEEASDQVYEDNDDENQDDQLYEEDLDVGHQLDDEELLIRDENKNNIVISHEMLDLQSKKATSDRERQLESLHYATATAAALLNVTANAAAVFAAAGDNGNSNKQKIALPPPRLLAQPKPRRQAAIYSETYHDLRQTKNEPYQVIAASNGVRAQQVGLQQQSYRSPVYATALDYQQVQRGTSYLPTVSEAFKINQHTRQRAMHPMQPVRAPIHQQQLYCAQAEQQQQHALNGITYGANIKPIGMTKGSRNPVPLVNYNNLQQHKKPATNNNQYHQFFLQQHQISGQQQQQQPIYRHQLRNNQPMPHSKIAQPRPNLAMVAANSFHHHQMRLGQAQIALQPNGVPALAILHHNGKTAAMKVDLIGMNAQRPQHQPQQLQNKFAPTIDQQKQHKAYSLLVAQHEKSQKQASQQQQQVYGAARPFISAITSSPSDTSGNSNLPLILDGRLKNVSFVEKVCRVDLSFFWRCLLSMCIVSIVAVITITRYIY